MESTARNTTKLNPVLCLQVFMITLDLCLNTLSPWFYWQNTVQLMLYILQDTCTVMALIVMFLTFFSTYVFQAGLISLLIGHFRVTIISSLIYLSLSIGYHVWSLRLKWKHEYDFVWNTGLITLFACQRTTSALYYYFYKRAALMISDPKYNRDTEWLRNQIERHTSSFPF